MATTMAGARGGGDGNERRAEETADFLRRLSIADAKVLLERTRKEKENKTKEMQKMIGVRYRDLIESADKIVNMHSAALRLEVSLKEMPDKWRHMEVALTSALASESPTTGRATEKKNINPASGEERGGVLPDDATVAEKVAFLVDVPEKMWQFLDEGKTLQALLLYQRAEAFRGESDVASAEQEFPFLPARWACIQRFRPRMVACAKTYLTCRGKDGRFYADNLCTLAMLQEPQMTVDELFAGFLDARSKWMTHSRGDTEEDYSGQSFSRRQQALVVVLKTIGMTVIHTEQIFGDVDGGGLLDGVHQLPTSFKDALAKFVSSGKMLEMLSGWFEAERRQINAMASPIISSIDSISRLSQVQAKLSTVNKAIGGCRTVKLWGRLLGVGKFTPAESEESELHAPVDSVFSVLFAESFRTRTRNLVQNSFIEALEAIKTQIRGSLGEAGTSSARVDYRLRCVKFYDYFETIQMKAAALDASDLQSVLTEEFLRTLLMLVVFFEKEYPLPGEQGIAKHDGEKNGLPQDPSLFLGISNIFAGIVAGFPDQMNKLFPGTTGGVSIPEMNSSLVHARSAFDKHSEKGFVGQKILESALQETLANGESAASCFIDEEVKRVDSFGFHAFYLVSEIKRRASYPQLFVNVLHSFSTKYCEAWAAILLKQKIEPLQELMQMEQYDSTNEEWIAAHEGWSEQVISNEMLSGGDTDGSSSEADMTFEDEKVWLPWCETPTVSSFVFSCCYSLDEANRMVRTSVGAEDKQVKLMQRTIREVLIEQLTIVSVAVYDEAVSLLVNAKAGQKDSVLNFGECCILQFLFDMYFIRATLGFSDFIRFGWGDELDPEECSPGLLKLKGLFERMQDFVDPVDWEIYGPQLVENVVLQFRKGRLLFSSLSESNDINEINGKEIIIAAQDTRSLARIAEPVARFSLLPVPSSRRRFQRTMSAMSRSSEDDASEGRSRANSTNLFHERGLTENGSGAQASTLKLQNLLSGSTGSNLLSAAASGTNLLSSAAKGIGFLSSATSSYLREGEARPSNTSSRYF